jgi:hypothetical protein
MTGKKPSADLHANGAKRKGSRNASTIRDPTGGYYR